MGIFNPSHETLQAWSHWGSGIDGHVVYAVNTTLHGNVNAIDITVNAGVIVTANGFILMAQRWIRNNGHIMNDGIGTAGAGAGILPGGGNAGAGAINAGAAGIGNTDQGLGGSAGRGGDGSVGAGGAGGSITISTAYSMICMFAILAFRYIYDFFYQSRFGTLAGGGGGGGGGNNIAASGKNGGGGGGGLTVSAPYIYNDAGIISCDGVNGVSATVADTGGGGGGGGGFLQLISYNVVGGICRATAGLGGLGIAGGSDGDPGVDGYVIRLIVV